jgi:hypothetical protein
MVIHKGANLTAKLFCFYFFFYIIPDVLCCGLQGDLEYVVIVISPLNFPCGERQFCPHFANDQTAEQGTGSRKVGDLELVGFYVQV